MCKASNAYVNDIKRLSRWSSNPARAFNIMRHVINTTIRLLRAEYVVDLFDELIHRDVPLRSVKVDSDRLCKQLPSRRSHDTAMRVMRWRRKDAVNVLIHEKKENTKVWRESERLLWELDVLDSYFQIWEEEKDYQRRQFTRKYRRKVDFLTVKYGRKSDRNVIPDEVEGIVIKDTALPENFESKPRMYGGVNLDQNNEVTSALSLPPKFTVYENVDPERCEIEVDKAISKYRWSVMSGEERVTDEQGEFTIDGTRDRVWPLDYETNSIDYRKMRAMDLPFNKRIQLPDPVDPDVENDLQNLKHRLKSVTSQYCHENKNNKYSNLTSSERNGLKEVCRDQELVVFQTDKSGRFSVDTRDNYKAACAKHVPEEDVEITEDEYTECQRVINAHSTLWTRILNAGEEVEGGKVRASDRIRNNLLVQNHSTAPLYALRKDHKEYADDVEGPPTRPVCAANTAYNSKLSHLMCSILKPVWQSNEYACESTEDLLAAVRDLNGNEAGIGPQDEVIIGSLDVKALYPSLDIDATADVVVETFVNSEFEVEGVDSQELGLYLAVNLPRMELVRRGIANYCHTRKHRVGAPPKVTGCATDEDRVKRFAPWNPPYRHPDARAKKEMLAVALSVAVKLIMKNHVYSFDGKMRKQSKGGPIGLDLTGDLAQIFMMWWDREFLRRLERQGIRVLLYKRYVDDIIIVFKAPDKRTKFVKEGQQKGRLVVSTEYSEKASDAHAMELLRLLGNDIHPSIQLECEYPSMHGDNKLPLLDVKMWVTTLEGKGTQLMHEYYQKKVASRSVVHARSSLPWSTKRTVLTQEVLRILLRCSPDLPWTDIKSHVETFMQRMQFSGYTVKFKGEIVKSAFKAYRVLKEKDERGEQPLYRPKMWKRVDRQKERRMNKMNWFKKGGNMSVVFVPATPGSELKKRYEAVVSECRVGMKVVEKSGMSVKSIVQKSDPFQRQYCGDRENCMVCSVEGSKGRCRQSGVMYKIGCSDCDYVYIGETSRNAYTRGCEHTNSLEKKKEDSVLHRHITEQHPNYTDTPQFSMKVVSRHPTALDRQTAESVKIANSSRDRIMNSKHEFGHNKNWRVQLLAD